MTAKLPDWAEVVLRAYGAPIHSEAAAARYRQIEGRMRRRWRAELQPSVWALFNGHEEQAAILLGLMLDLAATGSQRELEAKRQALLEMARLESDLRAVADVIVAKVTALDELVQKTAAFTGIDEDVLHTLQSAAQAVALQSWREPSLSRSDHADAISSRKSQRDALMAMLGLLELFATQLKPVELTDAARATIYNVIHDCDGDGYSAEAVKKARADLRRRR